MSEPKTLAERAAHIAELYRLLKQVRAVIPADSSNAEETLRSTSDWHRLSDESENMAALIAEQQARIVELERDAARYRWLRSPRCDWHIFPEDCDTDGDWLPENLDAAIDAAMRAAEGEV